MRQVKANFSVDLSKANAASVAPAASGLPTACSWDEANTMGQQAMTIALQCEPELLAGSKTQISYKGTLSLSILAMPFQSWHVSI